MSKQHARVSQGRTCSDNYTCRQTESNRADQTSYLNQSQYTDTGTTSLSADPTTPGAWQGSHMAYQFEVTGMIRPEKKAPRGKPGSNPGAGIMEADYLQVTTLFTIQPSFHHRHSANRVSWSVTIVGERAVTPHLVARQTTKSHLAADRYCLNQPEIHPLC